MNRFEYLEARTLPEAIALLGQDEGTRIVAGATDFLVRWRQGLWKPRAVLNIKRIPGLDRVDYSPETGLEPGSAGHHSDAGAPSAHPAALPRAVPGGHHLCRGADSATWRPSAAMSVMPPRREIPCQRCSPMGPSAASSALRVSGWCPWRVFS